MITMKSFDVGFETFLILHDSSEDSRTVINERTGDEICKIDRDLHVFVDRKFIGSIVPSSEEWKYVVGPNTINLNVNVNDFHWKQLLEAEVELAKNIILNNKLIDETLNHG